MKWFRLHAEILNDPRVQTLESRDFKIYINLLCHACLIEKSGNCGNVSDVSFALRETIETVSSAFQIFEKKGLIETVGETFQIPQWKKKQYKSDVSTSRVKRHRRKTKRSGNVSETPPESDSESDTERDISLTGDSQNSENFEVSLPNPIEVAFRQFQEFAKKHGLPKPTKLTKKRRAALKARFSEHGGPKVWQTVLAEIEASPGLKGANSRGWQVDFDFLTQPSSLQKLLEGKYRNWGKANNHDEKPDNDEFRQAAARGTLGARFRD